MHPHVEWLAPGFGGGKQSRCAVKSAVSACALPPLGKHLGAEWLVIRWRAWLVFKKLPTLAKRLHSRQRCMKFQLLCVFVVRGLYHEPFFKARGGCLIVVSSPIFLVTSGSWNSLHEFISHLHVFFLYLFMWLLAVDFAAGGAFRCGIWVSSSWPGARREPHVMNMDCAPGLPGSPCVSSLVQVFLPIFYYVVYFLIIEFWEFFMYCFLRLVTK